MGPTGHRDTDLVVVKGKGSTEGSMLSRHVGGGPRPRSREPYVSPKYMCF